MNSAITSQRAAKARLLKDAEYVYNYEREMYVNRKARKAFSVDFLEDQSEKAVQAALKEPAPTSGWRFYFNEAPSAWVQQELEKAFT